MKPFPALLFFATSLAAHDVAPADREALRAHVLEEWQRKRGMAEVASAGSSLQLAAEAAANAANAPRTAKAFLPFPKLDLRAEGEFLFVGSNGLPDHNMMVGITAWQQQVPLPQAYFGENAWRIPLNPVPAKEPAMIQGRFLRGAIALAVNGVPIFNPQNNRGEISYEIGELDEWGGHCGRADDYHYHIAPLHLQAQAGKGMPIAYALDGYPIFGLTEPDGSPVRNLDVCHGHDHDNLGYHYHASMKYPYVIGGFHGVVEEREGQVDPQPRAQGVREALPALRGARITAFESTGKDSYKLSYEVDGDPRSVSYAIRADGSYPFHFENGREGSVDEVYTARRQGGGQGRPPGGGQEGMKGKGRGQPKGGREGEMRRGDEPPPRPGEEGGRPPRPQAASDGILDVNGDGVVTAQEFADNAKSSASKKGIPLAEAMSQAKAAFAAMDKDRSGQLEGREWQESFGGVPAPVPPQEEDRPKRGGAGEPRRPKGGQGGPGGGPVGRDSFVQRPDQPRSSDGKFLLSSPAVEDLAEMPRDFTGEGEGVTLPLAWKDAPEGTKGYALIMDHADKEGTMKWYWTLYDIPADVTELPKNAQGIGRMGTGFKGRVGYEPPMSKGAGSHTYVITMYALREPLKVTGNPGREELLAAMQGQVLASSSLRVVHVSGGAGTVRSEKPEAPPEPPPPQGPEGRKAGGKGKGGPPGLIKPGIADTMKLNVYADNWFMLYVNGRLVAVDSIPFTPHNVVSVDFLPEYPMTLAVLAKDNADPKTGLEYGSSIGDGGFILKFADGTVTDASWKAKNFFHGPVNGNTANPQVQQEPLPENWWAVDFDDSAWNNAKEYTVEQVDPKQPYFEYDFAGARFIWTDDLALDNTVIFRTRIEKPGWTPRWNTKPDLDVSGAPLR